MFDAALTDFLRSSNIKRMIQTTILFLTTIIITATAQLLFKKGMMVAGKINFSFQNLFKTFISIFTNGWLFLGLVAIGIAFLLWLMLLSKTKLSVVYPIAFSLQIAIITFTSYFLFEESLNALQVIGITCIIVGIYLLTKV